MWQKSFINITQLSKSPSEFDLNTFIYKVINKEDINYAREITYIIASDCRSIDKNITQNGRTYLGQKFVWIKVLFHHKSRLIFSIFCRVK